MKQQKITSALFINWDRSELNDYYWAILANDTLTASQLKIVSIIDGILFSGVAK